MISVSYSRIAIRYRVLQVVKRIHSVNKASRRRCANVCRVCAGVCAGVCTGGCAEVRRGARASVVTRLMKYHKLLDV